MRVQVTTMYHLDRPMYLLGYLASLNRVFLVDKCVRALFCFCCSVPAVLFLLCLPR